MVQMVTFIDSDNMAPSEAFIQRHFLAGTLLKQVHLSLNEAPQKRKSALSVLKELLIKHEIDDRYKWKTARARIASLYAPWLPIVCGEYTYILVHNQLIMSIVC